MARKLAKLEQEREELRARLEGVPHELDSGALRALIEARVQDFGAALQACPDAKKRALRALLGDRRIQVHPDDARGFRVEGLVSLPLMRETPGISEDPGRLQALVAGGRYATLETAPLRYAA